ncbi:MAG: hypothetical protein ABFS28_09605 [Bacteroidota bacterium]
MIRQQISILLLILSFAVSAQDRLIGETAGALDKRSGRAASFRNLARVRMDVSGINTVMVLSGFDTMFDRGSDPREGLYKLTDGSTESQVIQQSLNMSGGQEKGIGTLVYIFDASSTSGQVNYTLQHSSSSRSLVRSSGTVVAIALTTSASTVDIPFDLKSISAAVNTSGTLNEWNSITGLSTQGIQLATGGNIYVSASINSFANGTGAGEWKLQHSTDQSNWTDMGNSTSLTFNIAREYATSSLSWIIEDLTAGAHYFRVLHRQTEGTAGDLRTLNSNLIACALVYEVVPGSTREFPSFALRNPSSATSLTTMTPVISHSIDPSNATGLFLHAQYVASADIETDAAAYDLSINQAILDGIDQNQHVPSSSFTGGGASVGLGSSMQPGTSYGISLRHQTASGTTLNTRNATLAGFQLTSVGNSIWTGAGSSPTTWENSDNWSGDAPGDRDNALIPGGLSKYPILTSSTACENLQIGTGGSLTLEPAANLTVHGQLENNGNLEVQSSGAGTGSIIPAGQSSGAVSYQNYLTADQWHIFSPPVIGQSINSFLQNSTNLIPWSDTYGAYGMTDYNELNNSWNGFFTDASGGDLTSGKGYLMRREISDGAVSSRGELLDSDLSVGITADGSRWNAVGNPFSSAIGITSDAVTTEDFLSANLDQLDPNYSVLYLWEEAENYDGTQNNYKVIGNAGYVDSHNYPELDMDYLQAGQGFLVKSASGGGSLLFSKAMQVHQNGIGLLKNAGESWDGFKLVAESGDRRESTIICFQHEMTPGLDPSYDAGLLNSKPDFSVYTRLLEDDEGINFKIQCLPDTMKSDVVVPLGVDLASGGELALFTEGIIMPEQYQIFLEDSLSGQMVDLSSAGTEYKVMLEKDGAGPGRFFLHIHSTEATRSGSVKTREPHFYGFSQHQVFTLKGMAGDGAIALLYDLRGRNVGTYRLQRGELHHIPASTLKDGIYLVMVIDGPNRNTLKIFKNEP